MNKKNKIKNFFGLNKCPGLKGAHSWPLLENSVPANLWISTSPIPHNLVSGNTKRF